MKQIILIAIILLSANSAIAHGYPTFDDLQMFPESTFAQPFASLTGAVVGIPCAIVGAVIGTIAGPFCNGIKEGFVMGTAIGGISGYMIGQQAGWPVYGIEKGIWWVIQ